MKVVLDRAIGDTRACKCKCRHRKLLIHDAWPENDVTYEQSQEITQMAGGKIEEVIAMGMYDIHRAIERTVGHEVLLTKKQVYGLLTACDAYIEAEAELHVLKRRGPLWEGELKARKKLEEMLR